LIAFIGTIIWSSTAVIIRFLTSQRQMPPIVLAFWRDLIVCLIFCLVLAIFQRKLLRLPRKHAGFMLFYGLLLAVFNTTWTLSVYYNGAAVSTVLVGIRNVAQAEMNCGVSDLPPMSDELEIALRKHNWRRAFWYEGMQ
jgi:drug/metabolite transporter (DMT)-like permease